MINFIKKAVIQNHLGSFGVCKFSKLKNNLISCRALTKLPNDAQSVIVFLFPYKNQAKNGNLSRYSIVRDYHIIGMEILSKISEELSKEFPEFKFVPFIDNSPIPEVSAAVEAGLGVRGKNSLLINKEYGSWVFIGEIVTNAQIEISDTIAYKKTCIDCKKCIQACPGKAICKNGIDKNNCISHITQKKGTLSSEEIEILKSSTSVWGCDICQEACPMNKNAKNTSISYFTEEIVTSVNIGDYSNLTQRAFQWRPKQIIERNIEIISNS